MTAHAGRAIGARTRLVGLIGWPVAHSRSPAIHNAAFAALGLDWCYVPLPVPPGLAGAAVAGLAALGLAGANVTVPHKQAVLPYLIGRSDEVGVLGAANTLVVRDEAGQPAVYGHNTDHAGFVRALADAGIDAAGCRAVVLGAGGAARAVVYGLLQAGAAAVSVLNRSPERAEALVAELGGGHDSLTAGPLEAGFLGRQADQADLLINATTIGMEPAAGASPWPDELPLPRRMAVFDLVYQPRRTRLLAQAEAAGALAVGGLGMLVHQAALAFELWTGERAPLEAMWQAAAADE